MVMAHNDGVTPCIKLDTLPTDIIHEIITYLDLEDALLLTIVNRYFYTLLPRSNGLWTRFFETNFQIYSRPPENENIYHFLARIFPKHRCVVCKAIWGFVELPVHDLFRRRLCYPCLSGNPEYWLISDLNALNKYKSLCRKDLASLRHVRGPAIFGQRFEALFSTMSMYSLQDVKCLAAQKIKDKHEKQKGRENKAKRTEENNGNKRRNLEKRSRPPWR